MGSTILGIGIGSIMSKGSAMCMKSTMGMTMILLTVILRVIIKCESKL